MADKGIPDVRERRGKRKQVVLVIVELKGCMMFFVSLPVNAHSVSLYLYGR